MAKCLVADDSKIIRMLFAKIMGNLGFDVTEAEDGEEVDEREQERYGNPGRQEDSRRYGGLFAGERDGG